jgi:hypothetical protein
MFEAFWPFPLVKQELIQVQDPITKKWTRTGPLNILVNIMSATSCGRDWENTNDFKISLNSDHRDMIKFGSNDHEGYPKVKMTLEDLAEDANQILAARDNGKEARLLHLDMPFTPSSFW